MDAPMITMAFLDRPPESDRLTAYDESHLAVYIRLLDADAEGADWREAVQIIFGIEPERALNRLERQGFAWEFLRRNPNYRSEYDRLRSALASRPGASQRSTTPQWGLRFPDRSQPLRS